MPRSVNDAAHRNPCQGTNSNSTCLFMKLAQKLTYWTIEHTPIEIDKLESIR